MAGTITAADQEFVETWEHISPAQHGIVRLDPRGDEKHEIITGRRTFMLTTAERVITQDRIVDQAHDPFLNGAFRPVVVPDSVSRTSNPNALADDEILSLFASSETAWAEWLAVLDSPQTLQRMIDLAEDAPTLSLRRFRQVQERLAAVKPRTRVQSKALEDFENAGGRATPSGSGNPRRQGGRSSDYR